MKRSILVLLIVIFSNFALAEAQQDIVFKSRFDLESSEAFIGQVRIFLENSKFGDPYSQEFKKPISIDLAKALDEIPEDTQKWIKDLQAILQIKLFESNFKMIVDKFSYRIDNFNAEFKPGSAVQERVDYVTVNYVKGLNLTAEKIGFEVELMTASSPIKFSIELLRPTFIISPELLAKLPMGWSTAVMDKNIILTLESVDISEIMKQLIQNPDLIDFKIDGLNMPEVSVRVGRKEIQFDRDKILSFFDTRRDDLKKAVLDLVSFKMSDKLTNVIKDNPKKLNLDKSYAIQGELNGVFDVQEMAVNRTGIVQVDLDGHFCDSPRAQGMNFCQDQKVYVKKRREVDLASYQKSLREMNRSLIERKTNIALSVSEDYLNQLIQATINSGAFEESLKGKDFSLGPEKAFVLAEERGDFSFYLDIVYRLTGIERILVGRSELRFPVKLMIGLKIEELHDVPHFTIRVKKVIKDANLLREGIPQYSLPSTVGSVSRFQNKVINTIFNEISSFEGESLLDVEMSELKGTYFHKLELYSDGLGRGTATIGFNPTENI